MVLTGASDLGAASAVSSSDMPFLKALMPLATSPIMSEILPRPPKTRSSTAPTTNQCQMLNEPMKTSVRNGTAHLGPAATCRFRQNLGAKGGKNKHSRNAQRPQGESASFPAIAGRDDLFLAAAGGRRQAEVEIARFERVFVVAERRIVGRHRNAEARGQRRLDQARAFELVEAGQIVERLQPEMGQE